MREFAKEENSTLRRFTLIICMYALSYRRRWLLIYSLNVHFHFPFWIIVAYYPTIIDGLMHI